MKEWNAQGSLIYEGGNVIAKCERMGTHINARLMAAAPDLLEVLRDVEWAGQTDAEEGGYVSACPLCDAQEDTGHDEHCRLAAAIAKATGEK